MIIVNITKTITRKKGIKKIEISGHATAKAKNLLNPLCLGVSSVTLGTVNAFNYSFPKLKTLITIETKKRGHLIFLVKKMNPEIELILELMITQLKTIASYFPKDLKIIKQKN